MGVNFDMMRLQINSMTNDKESLFVSGKGDNAKLDSAGTFGRMFRSSSSFVEGAKTFLDGIAEKYGDGIRQMAYGMAINSYDNGKFGLTVGMAKEIMAKCEMLAGMREELSVLTDPNSARVCARVLQDRLAEPGADVEKINKEVRVLATMLKGANLSPEEGAALANALKGVTIPSQGAIAMIFLARLPNHPLREITPPDKLPLLFGVLRHLTNCQTETHPQNMGDGTFNFANIEIDNIAKTLGDGKTSVYIRALAPKYEQLAKLAKHGPPTKAMIAQLLLDNSLVSPYLPANLIETTKVSKMTNREFGFFLADFFKLNSIGRWLSMENSPLPFAPKNAKGLLEGTIFSYEKLYDHTLRYGDYSDVMHFADTVCENLGAEKIISKFKTGNCPPITKEMWKSDPAKFVKYGLGQLSNYGYISDEKTLEALDIVGDLKRMNRPMGQELSLSVSENGSTSSVKIGRLENVAEMSAQVDNALSRCKSMKQKLMLGVAMTQSGVMVIKDIAGLFNLAKPGGAFKGVDEHIGFNLSVNFNNDGSVSVSYKFPKNFEERYGKLDLTFSIDRNGNIKTDHFRYELPEYLQNGQPPPANH